MGKRYETILDNTVHIFGDVTRALIEPTGVEMLFHLPCTGKGTEAASYKLQIVTKFQGQRSNSFYFGFHQCKFHM